jgi:hypothetical protein
MISCKNCGRRFDSAFCPSCGQKSSVKRLEMRTLLAELPSAIWHVDRGLVFNLIELFKRPGYAIRDYLDGKRKNFYHPVSYLLVVLATMFIAMNVLQIHYYDPRRDAWMTPDQAAFWKDYDATQQAWIHYYKYFVPFYLPWMALFFYGWLRVMRAPYTYAEALCIAFFVSAQMTVPQIVVLVLAYTVDNPAFTRASEQWINYPVLLCLFGFQIYQLGSRSLKTGARAALAVLGAVLMLAFAFTAIGLFLALVNAIAS